MRRGAPLPLALVAVTALMAAPQAARAQVSFGAHLARATDAFGGVDGLGARVVFGLPLVPLEVAVTGDLFRPDCPGDGCAYRSAQADARFRLLPASPLTPMLIGGWAMRWIDTGPGDTAQREGLVVGAGAELRLGVRLFAEADYELVDPGNQWVVRVGVLF